ncbi:Na+/H+ antiporter subunit G [Xinfangfangia sp. CPCC 101601]|uniref:Na+/H+ antiporter subunit G n=1 Tax=Pseudogemmobacter lacusdianii TaxID=3069608 RepID=A0ABU0VW85_9RHOB|nr:Na+/H+ antiporter subunit G [Xinfangfangia sp. CPCC 101601]MDQ2065984.1 Na+/H+ antiporter subunit G [Xinfangfangia sp. CPCC 101601]
MSLAATIIEIIAAALLVAGGLFAVIGSLGLLRLKQSMQRLHAPTKATTLGIGSALVAVAVHIWLNEDRLALRELAVALFFFLTAPLSALFLSKAHLFRSEDAAKLPPTGTKAGWATLSEDNPAEPSHPQDRKA